MSRFESTTVYRAPFSAGQFSIGLNLENVMASFYGHTRTLFIYFQLYKHNLQQINLKNVHPVSNSRSLEHESPPITTWPGLPPYIVASCWARSFSSFVFYKTGHYRPLKHAGKNLCWLDWNPGALMGLTSGVPFWVKSGRRPTSRRWRCFNK